MFSKILIANRGEIAVRIIRACKEMGISTVAVYSEADREALHVSLADESICIGGPQTKDSYLNMTSVLSAAIVTGAEAIHPGYGLLSENPKFAALCQECNIVFIGPDAATISLMGDKDQARKTMRDAGVPVIPGGDVMETLEEAEAAADEIGYPLLIKARSGGGGRGIRKVDSHNEFAAAYKTASAEAESAFGDGAVYLEKYLYPAKHIEVQILADKNGDVISLGERNCSIQRKNQKLIEESPSPALPEETRQRMLETAVKAAKAVKYENAGTLEFLVTEQGDFYFMEMNTRLQVEHPITEEVIGVDLVKEQIKVADGQVLQLKQENIQQRGHAIECRICAEDTEMNFMPSPGIIKQITEPNSIGVRIDSYVYEGYEIPIYYDPMIGKLIVWATNREYAIERMRRVLHEYKLTGVKNNISYLRAIMDTPDFVEGHYDTGFITKNGEYLQQRIMRTSEHSENIALIAAYMDYLMNLEENNSGMATDNRPISKWKEFGLHKGVLRI